MMALELLERPGRATSSVAFDEDSFLLTCVIEHGEYAPPRSFGEALGERLGVRPVQRVLTVGDVLFTVGPDDRLEGFEWRTGPNVLHDAVLPRSADPPAKRVVFLADWDENGRADVRTPTLGLFDRATRTLLIRFAGDAVLWAALADGVRLAVSADHQLAALQVDHVPTDLAAQVRAGLAR